MNHDDRKKLGILLNTLAMYYGRQINTAAISMYVDDLLDFPIEEIAAAVSKYRKTPGNNRFPLPADLIKIMRPKINPHSQAVELSSKIVEMVSLCGWTNPGAAREALGELGWQIVQRSGGWQFLCENLGVNLSIGTFTAQTRDLAESLLEFESLAIDTYAPRHLLQEQKNQLDQIMSGFSKNDLNEAIGQKKEN